MVAVRHLTTTASGLSLEYQRRCNEAPIGVVVSSPQVGELKRQIQVGMLVARFPNLHCAAEASTAGDAALASGASVDQTSWVALQETEINLPRAASLVALNPQQGMDLQLRAPDQLTLAGQRESQKMLRMSYSMSGRCGAAYAVYAHDSQGMLAVGILTIGAMGAMGAGVSTGEEWSALNRPCDDHQGGLVLNQPFVSATVEAERVYPLRLKGL
jgi:hypothetical protein